MCLPGEDEDFLVELLPLFAMGVECAGDRGDFVMDVLGDLAAGDLDSDLLDSDALWLDFVGVTGDGDALLPLTTTGLAQGDWLGDDVDEGANSKLFPV